MNTISRIALALILLFVGMAPGRAQNGIFHGVESHGVYILAGGAFGARGDARALQDPFAGKTVYIFEIIIVYA